ncbi:MAG TPA: hypothetical protein VMI93_02555 [Candidatus Solibacter sp.]|nr:hypothetical protein [Candidatus Solibacter sp.]
MRRLLIVAALLLFAALPCRAQNPTAVQVGANTNMLSCAACSSLVFNAFNNNVGAGHQLFAFSYCGTGSRTLSISGSQTWTLVQGPISVAAGGEWYLWAAYNTVSATESDTVTASGGTCERLYISEGEFSNVASSSFDQGPASASGLTSGNVTTTGTVELLIGALAGGNGGTKPAAGTGYTIIAASNAGDKNPGWEYKVVTSCGAYNAAFTSATGTVQSNILTFKGTASSACGGGTAPPPTQMMMGCCQAATKLAANERRKHS